MSLAHRIPIKSDYNNNLLADDIWNREIGAFEHPQHLSHITPFIPFTGVDGMAAGDLWNQPQYRVRKKVASIATKYFIEDGKGNLLGFTKQKMMKLKEDIRIYTDKKMKTELFQIRQTQIVDAWGNYAVIDTATNVVVGNIKRSAGRSMIASEYLLMDPNGQQIGRIFEEKGKGALRRFMPGGGLIPQSVKLEFGGQVVGEIKQKFKMIGDIWEADASQAPPNLDRRVLIGALLMMAMIERKK